MDVDLVVNRDQKELDLEAVKLRAVRVGVKIREAPELERVHLVKEEVLLKGQLLSRRLRQEELLLKRMYVAAA